MEVTDVSEGVEQVYVINMCMQLYGLVFFSLMESVRTICLLESSLSWVYIILCSISVFEETFSVGKVGLCV